MWKQGRTRVEGVRVRFCLVGLMQTYPFFCFLHEAEIEATEDTLLLSRHEWYLVMCRRLVRGTQDGATKSCRLHAVFFVVNVCSAGKGDRNDGYRHALDAVLIVIFVCSAGNGDRGDG